MYLSRPTRSLNMKPFARLFVRDESDSSSSDPTMNYLLTTLLILALSGLLLLGALYMLKKRRSSTEDPELPMYEEKATIRGSHHRRSAIITSNNPSDSIYVYQERQELMARSSSPPPSPVPEIRITFPEEVDHSGKRQSGKVVIVRVGENGAQGLEPVDEIPPPYHQDNRFQSLDLDRIGGLKEKELEARWS
ncbi:MAG: hypothetical protein M1821_010014 [Bathelium mastoideum]|nr:MAG: hypothetical protein M1821_010014 [Bathelium mastoideum]